MTPKDIAYNHNLFENDEPLSNNDEPKLTGCLITDPDDCPRLVYHSTLLSKWINKSIFWISLLIVACLSMLFIFNPLAKSLAFIPMVFGAVFFGFLGVTILIKSYDSYNKIRFDYELDTMGSWWGDFIHLIEKILVIGEGVIGFTFSVVITCSYIAAYLNQGTPNLIFAISGLATFTPYVFIGLFVFQSIAGFIEIAKMQYTEKHKKVLHGIVTLTINTFISVFILATFGVIAVSGVGNAVLFGFAILGAAYTCFHKYKEAFKAIRPLGVDVNMLTQLDQKSETDLKSNLSNAQTPKTIDNVNLSDNNQQKNQLGADERSAPLSQLFQQAKASNGSAEAKEQAPSLSVRL